MSTDTYAIERKGTIAAITEAEHDLAAQEWFRGQPKRAGDTLVVCDYRAAVGDTVTVDDDGVASRVQS
jgi:hypothetical protein